MRTRLPRIAVADYSDALGRYGAGSPEVEGIRRRYAHLEGFSKYADSLDTVRRSLGRAEMDCEPLLRAAEEARKCRLIVRAGTEPDKTRQLRWRIGVALLRAGVWMLGWRASFNLYDLRDRGAEVMPSRS